MDDWNKKNMFQSNKLHIHSFVCLFLVGFELGFNPTLVWQEGPFFRKHKKKNYVSAQMVELAECEHKGTTWFHFRENQTFKLRGLLL